MKSIIIYITFLFLLPIVSVSQICETSTTQIIVDLSDSPSGEFIVGEVILNGDCCNNLNCVEFIVIPHSNSFSFSFNLYGGLGNGILYLNCDEVVTNNENFCYFGEEQFSLIFCNSEINYLTDVVISSYGLPDYNFDNITTEETCSISINSENISITSITPNTIGFYNNLLSCTTNCDEVIIDTSLLNEYVEYIDFKITPIYSEFINNVDFNCDGLINSTDLIFLLSKVEDNSDTIRVNITPKVNLNIIPSCETFLYTINGGTEPYNFILNGENVNEITPLEGLNTLIIESFLCSSDTVQFEWFIPKPPIEVFFDNNICLGENAFLTTFSNETLIWDFGDGTELIANGNVFHTYTSSGQFDVTVSYLNSNICDSELILPFTVKEKPLINADVFPLEGCVPLEVSFFSEFNVNYTYTWDLGFSTYNLNEFLLTLDNPSNYTVEHLVSNQDCVSDTSFFLTLYEMPISNFTISPDIVNEDELFLIDVENNSQFGNSYLWDFGPFSTTTFEPSFEQLQPGDYQISLTVTNDFGCNDISYGRLIIKPLFTFYVPNAFTPNNDGVNDLFFGEGTGIKNYEMSIYNRWGEKIFQSQDKDVKWDGGVTDWYVQNDVYQYVFKITDVLGKIHLIKGHVTVIR